MAHTARKEPDETARSDFVPTMSGGQGRMEAGAAMVSPVSPTDRPGGLAQVARDMAPWFHNLHLPDGTQTAPNHVLGDFPAYKWAELAPHLPEDLSGWTALDIGCNAGFYSFELARRGAHVTAVDSNPHYLAQAAWAAGAFGLDKRIEFRRMQVYELAREPGTYDLVLFLGVFYHLRYPALAMDIVREKVGRLLAFQTLTISGPAQGPDIEDLPFERRAEMTAEAWPRMAFIERSLAGDPTNWWVPSPSCVEALLRTRALTVVARPGTEVWLCEPDAEGEARRGLEFEAEFHAALGRRTSDRAGGE